jgi:hypothetical protein
LTLNVIYLDLAFNKLENFHIYIYNEK